MLNILFSALSCANQVPLSNFWNVSFFLFIVIYFECIKIEQSSQRISNTTRKVRTSRICNNKKQFSRFLLSLFVDIPKFHIRLTQCARSQIETNTHTHRTWGHPCTSFWCIQLNVSILQCELVPYSFSLFRIYSTIVGCFQASHPRDRCRCSGNARLTSYVIEFLPSFFNVECMRIDITTAPLNTVADGMKILVEKCPFTTELQSYSIFRLESNGW